MAGRGEAARVRARSQSGRGSSEGATDREVGVVAAVLVAGSEKAAAHRPGLSHSTVKDHLANARSKVGAATTAQFVWILALRLLEPEGVAQRTNRGLLDEVARQRERGRILDGRERATVPEPEDRTAEACGLGCLGVFEEVSQAFAATGSAHRHRVRTMNSRQGISITEKKT